MPLRGVGGLPPLLSRLSWAASFRQRRLLSSCQCHLCSRAFTVSLPPDFDTPSPPNLCPGPRAEAAAAQRSCRVLGAHLVQVWHDMANSETNSVLC